MNYSPWLARLLLVCCTISLTGCTWLANAIRSDKTNIPMELSRIQDETRLRTTWSVKVGKGHGRKYHLLKPAIAGTRIFAASYNGVVLAANIDNGRTQWRNKTRYTITGGVGVGGGLVLVGTENSQVVAFSESDGRELWVARVSSEVLAAPATNGRIVVVQTVDGNLIGLDAATGNERWTYENNVPALSLRGTGSPLIIDNFVIASLANGAVISIALDNGTLRWEERVTIPTGRSEMERLVDIDGDPFVNDAGLVLATTYQGYMAAIDVITGQIRWRAPASSYMGLGFGFGNVYLSDEGGPVKAFRIGQETPVWNNESLLRRRLSTPHAFSNYVAVGDIEGYVHLLSQVDGRIVGRTKVDRKGVRSRMLNQGNTLFVYGNSGKLVALRVE